MFVLRNACRSIWRSKGRSILMGIIVLLIAASSCLALSIRQAAETAREETLEGLSVTAQISIHPRYDSTTEDGWDAKLQFKEFVSIGLAYSFGER